MRRMALTCRPRESLERTVARQSNRTAGSYRRNIMTYIDGFVAAVPTANREKFKKHAIRGRKGPVDFVGLCSEHTVQAYRVGRGYCRQILVYSLSVPHFLSAQ